MKKISLFILTLIICFIGCIKDYEVQLDLAQPIEIAYSYEEGEFEEDWALYYTYDNEGNISTVEDLRSLGTRYVYDYNEENILQERNTYRISNDKLLFRDSMLYNPDGTLMAIYNFSINGGEDMPLSWIYEYEYNDDNMLSEQSTYFVRAEEYTSTEKYYWSGNNVERKEYYHGKNEALFYEYFYEYDDKPNTEKLFHKKDLSRIDDWNQNNVIKMDWNDYLGDLHISCRPCKYNYKYNRHGKLTRFTTNSGLTTDLIYE